MRRKLIVSWVLFILVAFPTNAFSWGTAVHAYVADNIGKEHGRKNSNEIYAANGPDIFNYSFEQTYYNYLYSLTHNEFMKVWNATKSKREKSLAYGFISHNDLWGVDFTAHHSGRTFGQDKGYVIAKAELLNSILKQNVPAYRALQLPENVAIDICHNIVEASVDILISELNPLLSDKIIDSVSSHSAVYHKLLVKAYARSISATTGISYAEAATLIKNKEDEYSGMTLLYAQSLKQDRETAAQLIAEQLHQLS